MRVIHPNVYLKQQERRRKKKTARYILPVLLVLFMSCYGYMALHVTPIYKVARLYPTTVKGDDTLVAWPEQGAAAMGYIGSDTEVLASHNGQQKLPTASTIKILTALLVLEQKPLGAREPGERIYFNNADVEMTNRIASEGGVYYPITNGMSMSYHQALELTLIGSMNNISEKLATWAFGGVSQYTAAASNYLKANNMLSTEVSDPSGLLATTQSTAEDMLKISLKAMQVPVIREIAAMKKTEVNGIVVASTNRLLDLNEGIDGLKTGYTPEAGACLILTRSGTYNSKIYTFVTVVLGQSDRDAVFTMSDALLESLHDQTTNQVVLAGDSHVADIRAPWGQETKVLSRGPLEGYRWSGETVATKVEINDTEYAKKNNSVGKVIYRDREVNAILANDLPKPSMWWRLTHAFDYLSEI